MVKTIYKWVPSAALGLLLNANLVLADEDPANPDMRRFGAGEWVAAELFGVQLGDDISRTLSAKKYEVISGSTGCNDYTATVSILGDSLQLSDITHAENACPTDQAAAAERAYLDALAAAASFEVLDDELRLFDEGGEVIVLLKRLD